MGRQGMLGVSLRGHGLEYWSELFLCLRRLQCSVAVFVAFSSPSLCLLLPPYVFLYINRLSFAWRYGRIVGCGFVVFPPLSLAWHLEIRLHRQWLRRCQEVELQEPVRRRMAWDDWRCMSRLAGQGHRQTQAAARLVHGRHLSTATTPTLALTDSTGRCCLASWGCRNARMGQ